MPTLTVGGPLLAIEPITFSTDLLLSDDGRLTKKRLDIAEQRSKNVRAYAITYRSNGHKVRGFMVEPVDAPKNGKMPCIIWNRGGTMDFGALTPWQVFAHLGMVASWGYVVIASQYSGNKGSEGKDEMGGADVEDVLKLRDVLRRHPLADLTRIGMCGGSRGGMMTYLCLARVKWLRGAVVNAGVADLERNARQRPEMAARQKSMFGGSKKAMRERSAVHWADRFCRKTPLLMLHGTNDWRVSPQDSLDMSSALLREGIHHQLVLFPGDDHYLTANRKKRWELTREWLDRFVRDGEQITLTDADKTRK